MKQFLFILLSLCFSVFLHAQTGIQGKVLDADGVPIIGATVLITGIAQGTVTDEEGYYSLETQAGDISLKVSSVGYVTQDKVVNVLPGSMVTQNFVLATDQEVLEELVVVAYGTKKKEDLTGSVTSVTSKDFQKGNISSPEQLLTGKVAGLLVTNGGGAAGGGSRIRIRSGAIPMIFNLSLY